MPALPALHRPPRPAGDVDRDGVPDFLFLLTLRQPNVPPLGNSLGTLDGAGTATATFALPPGLDPSLAGITLHPAAIVLNGPGKGAYLATNAASVALVD